MKKYFLFALLFASIVTQAQTNEKPSMLEYLSNVVLFNPTYVRIHETGGNMTHDIMVSGRWKYEVEFKNRKQDAIFIVLDDENKVVLEVKEEVDKAATVIDLTGFSPGIYTIQRKVNGKIYSFEVVRMM